MPRPYSDMFLRYLADTEDKEMGTQLAKLCVKANIPAAHAAIALEASRMTVYGWFRGREIRKKKRPTVEAFMKILREDLASGVLPSKNVAESKAYIAAVIGVKV